MHIRSTGLLLGLLSFVPACKGGEMPTPGDGSAGAVHGTPVPLTRLRSDSFAFALQSGLDAPQTTVIRDAAAWADLWSRIHAGMSPVPTPPSIDFALEMVLVAALGTRNSGGFSVLLAGASEDASGLRVEVVETSPGPGCMTTQALTQPVDLARTPRKDGPVKFASTQRVTPC